MDLFSQKVERFELEEGDHVYTWRKKIYSHHGIVIGHDKLIHFVNAKEHSIFRLSAVSSSSCIRCSKSYCGSEKVAGSGVRMSCIDCFIKKGALYRYKYEASSTFVVLKVRSGTCTTAKTDPPKEVIHKATYLYENGYMVYDLINNNCEDFALYCKTGLWSNDISHQGRSSQVESKHIKTRNETDVGTRKDVVRVPVEGLASFLADLILKRIKG